MYIISIAVAGLGLIMCVGDGQAGSLVIFFSLLLQLCSSVRLLACDVVYVCVDGVCVYV